MLRRPSVQHATGLEEGCSSNAIDPSVNFFSEGWNNPTNRGSSEKKFTEGSALP
jgi:hypothetical protein